MGVAKVLTGGSRWTLDSDTVRITVTFPSRVLGSIAPWRFVSEIVIIQ